MQLKIRIVLSFAIQGYSPMQKLTEPLQPASQNKKGGRKNVLTNHVILPHPPRGVHVGVNC